MITNVMKEEATRPTDNKDTATTKEPHNNHINLKTVL